jgi:hypothetical protein
MTYFDANLDDALGNRHGMLGDKLLEGNQEAGL